MTKSETIGLLAQAAIAAFAAMSGRGQDARAEADFWRNSCAQMRTERDAMQSRLTAAEEANARLRDEMEKARVTLDALRPRAAQEYAQLYTGWMWWRR